MSFQINCPYCNDIIVSDVCDRKEDSSGEWQCNNGHTFVLKYITTMKMNPNQTKIDIEIKKRNNTMVI